MTLKNTLSAASNCIPEWLFNEDAWRESSERQPKRGQNRQIFRVQRSQGARAAGLCRLLPSSRPRNRL